MPVGRCAIRPAGAKADKLGQRALQLVLAVQAHARHLAAQLRCAQYRSLIRGLSLQGYTRQKRAG